MATFGGIRGDACTMSKNIILLSDGTGNSSSKLFKTNVWRLFQTLDLTDASKQVAYYDNGVGTSSFKLFAVLGGIFGFGLKRNVIDIYSFCCRNYVEGDKIFGFGFSRGAFTMRVVAGLIARAGFVPYNGDELALARYAASAYRDYRRRFNSTEGLVNPLRGLRDRVIRAYRRLAGNPSIRQGQTDPDRANPFPWALGSRRRLWRADRGNYARDRLLVLAAVDARPVHERENSSRLPRARA